MDRYAGTRGIIGPNVERVDTTDRRGGKGALIVQPLPAISSRRIMHQNQALVTLYRVHAARVIVQALGSTLKEQG